MCLTYPGKIREIKGKEAVLQVNEGLRRVYIGSLSNLKAGDYVLYNADLAVSKISKKEAEEIMRIFKGK